MHTGEQHVLTEIRGVGILQLKPKYLARQQHTTITGMKAIETSNKFVYVTRLHLNITRIDASISRNLIKSIKPYRYTPRKKFSRKTRQRRLFRNDNTNPVHRFYRSTKCSSGSPTSRVLVIRIKPNIRYFHDNHYGSGDHLRRSKKTSSPKTDSKGSIDFESQ